MAGLNSEAIKVLSRSTQTQQGNLSGVGAFAQKRFEDVFVESRAGSKSQGNSFVTSKQRTTIDLQGQINGTGVNSDIAIEGNGMFVVGDGSRGSEKMYSRRGDFRQDKLGFWVNGAGKYLFAWKLDEDGNMPTNSATLGSLESVNFANTKGDPKATTSISIAMNLNSDRATLRGAGPNLALNRLGKNNPTGKTNKDDIILPENLRSSGIEQGFRQKIKSIPPGNQEKTIEYGGIAIGRGATGASPIFGATSVTKRFDTTLVQQGSGLRITVGTETISFEAVSGNPDSKSNQFNTISSLATAINNTSRLKATIDGKTGAIYIAAKEQFIDQGITFADAGGTTFVAELGLTNIAAPEIGVKRFNSLLSMQSAVNSDGEVFELKAAINGQSIDITAKNPTSDFEMTVDSFGETKFTHALRGDGTERGRAAITIKSPNSGLQTGELVRLKNLAGIGDQFVDGIYAVGKVEDAIGFEVYLVTNDGALAAVAPPASTRITGLAAAAAPVAMTFAGASWQKVPGGSTVAKPAAITTAAAVALNTNAPIIITTPAAHGLIVGDVILVQGGGDYHLGLNDVKLPDGYYVITAVAGGNTFTINSAGSAAGVAFVAKGAGLTYHKVGHAPANGVANFNQANGITGGFDAKVFETGALGDQFVKLNLTNHNYSVGDYISFDDLVPEPYIIDGFALNNKVRYYITDTGKDHVNFQVPDGAGGFQAATAGGNRGNYSTQAGLATQSAIGNAFRVNNGTRVLEYFGLGGKQKDEDKKFEATYDAEDVNKSLSGVTNLNITKDARAFPTSDIFSQNLRAFDSLGSEFNLQIHFAKLNENEWAVEIASGKDPETGLFDAQGLGPDGKIAHGKIFFTTDGVFDRAEGGIANAISLERRNGSALTNITIDWENSANEIKSGTASQFSRTDSFEFTQQNGQSAGTLTNIEIDVDGYVVGTFDSGEVRKLYRVPIATFNDINGLTPGSGGTYKISKDSGELLLKGPNTPGAGKLIGGALELSNTDTTTELLIVKERSLQIQANARVVGVQSQDQKTILSETQ